MDDCGTNSETGIGHAFLEEAGDGEVSQAFPIHWGSGPAFDNVDTPAEDQMLPLP